ncbi:hypothetical protein ACH4VR_29720 [Streptomyces sp. NPDC020883]|uniref:hypothetical protein n=1 Tax=Streptomyces sp. NPDC020883 TaxID=3365099 RepID=UPI0037A14EBA
MLPPMGANDFHVPFFVLGADTVEEIQTIPLVTSVHRIENEIMPYSHASEVLGPAPVTDLWARTVDEEYDSRAKVVMVLDPVPTGVSTEYAAMAEGVLGPDLPPWLGLMLAAKLRCATRDVPCGSGTSVTSGLMDPSASTTDITAWAHQMVEPAV